MPKKTKIKDNHSGTLTLAKLKKEVKMNYDSTPIERFLFKFKREHFKPELSSHVGFGAQDLEPLYLDLYLDLLKEHKHKLVCKLMDFREVELWVKE
jgi:hypothetical protein